MKQPLRLVLQRFSVRLSTSLLALFHNIPFPHPANMLDIIALRSRNLVKDCCANMCSILLRNAVVLSLFLSPASFAENIIFDLFGVLVHIPTGKKIQHAGITDVLGYLLSDFAGAFSIKDNYMQALSKIPIAPETMEACNSCQGATAQGAAMPNILISWQAGTTHYREALSMIDRHLDKSESSESEKQVMRNAAKLTFDLETRMNAYQLMEQGVALVRRLASERTDSGKKRHRLFVLSNMDHEMIDHLTASHPQLFELFDGIVYSAQTKSLKPSPHIYEELIKQYDLDPKHSVMIDDQSENVDAAKALGMDGVVCTKHSVVAKKLEQLGLLTPIHDQYAAAKATATCASILSIAFMTMAIF